MLGVALGRELDQALRLALGLRQGVELGLALGRQLLGGEVSRELGMNSVCNLVGQHWVVGRSVWHLGMSWAGRFDWQWGCRWVSNLD